MGSGGCDESIAESVIGPAVRVLYDRTGHCEWSILKQISASIVQAECLLQVIDPFLIIGMARAGGSIFHDLHVMWWSQKIQDIPLKLSLH